VEIVEAVFNHILGLCAGLPKPRRRQVEVALVSGESLQSATHRSDNRGETAAGTAPQSLFYAMSPAMGAMQAPSGMISRFSVNYGYN
jgi:hypothetical protein